MKCGEKRGIFELFNIYSCNNCKYNKKDEEFLIGKNRINVYYSNIDCLLYNDYEKLRNLKVILFIKDIIYNTDSIILWIDKFDIDYNYELVEALLLFERDIHILVT